jgi:hypothetical protein
MRRGFGQYSTDSGLNTGGIAVGGGSVSTQTMLGQLDLLPFGGSSDAAESPILPGVSCTGPGCAAGTSGGGNAVAPQFSGQTLTVIILAVVAMVGMFIAKGAR